MGEKGTCEVTLLHAMNLCVAVCGMCGDGGKVKYTMMYQSNTTKLYYV